jgi:RHS repeat-associated protein
MSFDLALFGLTATPTATMITYAYDPLSRLTRASYSGAYTYTFVYAYDAVGNRTVQTRTITSTQVITYVYDNANRMTQAGGVTYTWDNNGNLTNDGSANYLYDRANRLISTTLGGATSLFNYNGDGVRLRQVVAGVITTYTQDLVAPLPVVLQAKTGVTTTKYLYSLGTRPIAQNTTAWEYFLPDELGSVRQIADNNGNVTLAKSYEPYGTVLTSTGSATSIFGFSGEQADTNWLIYLRARYMQPRLGIFLARDPWSGDAMRPGSMNGYTYGQNNPVRYGDPSGRRPCDDVDAEGHCTNGEPSRYPATLLDLRELGFEPGVDIDPLVYELYAHPESFEGYASVEYQPGIVADLVAPPVHFLISLFTGQGQIPDIYGEDELYQMRFTLACDVHGGNRWTREVLVDGTYQTLFDATWKVGTYHGEKVGIETFHISDLVGDVQVMLKPNATAQKTLVWRSRGILMSPNRNGEWQDLMKLPGSPQIIFETSQTSSKSILSIGQLFINTIEQARIKILGIYQGS